MIIWTIVKTLVFVQNTNKPYFPEYLLNNPLKLEFTIFIVIHYKPRIAVAMFAL